MHLADHLDRVGQPRDGRRDEPHGHGAAEPLAEPAGRLEALAHGARVVRARRGEEHGVALGESERVEPLGEHLDDAVVGSELGGEPGAAADAGRGRARGPVRTWKPAESTSGTMTASGSASAARAAATSALLASTKVMDTPMSGRCGGDAVDEPDHGLAIRGRRRAVGDGDEAERMGAERASSGSASTTRPDHLPNPALSGGIRSQPPVSTLCTACFADGTRVFPGREDCLTPRCVVAVVRVASSSGARPARVRSSCCSWRHAAIGAVVAREQHGRHLEPAPDGGLRVARGTRAARPRGTPRRGSRGCRRRPARAGPRPRSSPSRRPRRRSARSRRG